MLREANVYDIPRIYELGKLVDNNFHNVYNINEMLEDDVSKIIVYEDINELTGFIIATDLKETCDILSLVVDPSYRRKMVATNLLAYLIGDLSEDLKLITLEVATKNIPAINLYEKFGFQVVHVRKNYYQNGDDAYLMARKSE